MTWTQLPAKQSRPYQRLLDALHKRDKDGEFRVMEGCAAETIAKGRSEFSHTGMIKGIFNLH
jgi:hypothetical protein